VGAFTFLYESRGYLGPALGDNELSLTVRPIVGRRAKITALGTYVPPEVITNQDLEKMVDTNDQWIVERTGIRTRHRLAAGLGVSDRRARHQPQRT